MTIKTSPLPVFITIISFFLISYLSGCSKDEIIAGKIIGTWISTDKTDTLDIVDNNNFYKTVGIPHDHYNYWLETGSIEIQYEGVLKVLVHPTKHKYQLDNNTLTIDFSNKMCYGFERKEITYYKADD
jgi:hypothetical protein